MPGYSVARIERRGKPRIQCNYPAIVRGQLSGKHLRERARLRDFSVSGLYLDLTAPFECGTDLFVFFRLSSQYERENVTSIAVHGLVVRCDYYADSTYGVAIRFISHRVIS
jgi:hypothetical protein